MTLIWRDDRIAAAGSAPPAIAWEAWPGAGSHALAPGAGLIALRAADGTVSLHRRWLGDCGLLRTWPQSLRSDIGILISGDDATHRASAPIGHRMRVERRRPDDSEELLAVADIETGSRRSESTGVRWEVPPTDGPEGELARALVALVGAAAEQDPRALRLADGEAVHRSTPRLAHPLLWAPGEEPEAGMGSFHALAGGQLLRLLEGDPLRDAEGEEIRAERYWVHDPRTPHASLGTVLRTRDEVLWWRAGMQPGLDAPLAAQGLHPVEALLREALLSVGDEQKGV